MYELQPIYDSRKSFSGKATVEEADNVKRLYSYGKHVATITGQNATVKSIDSQTTLRHIKEFLLQNEFAAESLAQIKRDYLQ
jgi:hypothetical protein